MKYKIYYSEWRITHENCRSEPRYVIKKFIGNIVFYNGSTRSSQAIFENDDGDILSLPGDCVVATIPIEIKIK